MAAIARRIDLTAGARDLTALRPERDLASDS